MSLAVPACLVAGRREEPSQRLIKNRFSGETGFGFEL